MHINNVFFKNTYYTYYCRTESKSNKVKNNENTCVVSTRSVSNASW